MRAEDNDTAPAASGDDEVERRSWSGFNLQVLAVAIALVPVVVAPVRALARGWVAVGDNGLILLRSQDVFTAHHPLLGTWTSASLNAGRAINNPGPLWFDVLAPFVKVLGPSVGLAVGVMVANVLAVVFAAWAARRAGGPLAVAAVTALSAVLAWAMGSELLFDAWQPHSMILPMWALLVGLWALASGVLASAPWVVGVASLIVQTHLSFAYVVAVVGAASVMGAVFAVRGASDPVAWRRPTLIAAAVALLAWLQPVIDQIAGQGNLGALLGMSGGTGEPIGLGLGTRLIGSVVALPPWWARPGFSTTIVSTGLIETADGVDVVEGNVASSTAALGGLAVVVVVLAAVGFLARRRRDATVTALLAVAAAALAACFVSVALSPVNSIGLSPHQLRWLWPVGAILTAVPLVAAARWVPAPPAVWSVAAAAIIGVSAANLPTHAAREGPTADRAYGSTVDALLDGLADYDPGQPVVFDMTVIRFAEPYSGPLIAALARGGVDVVFTDDGMVHQVGEGRRATGDERRRLVLLEGAAVAAPPPGSRAISIVRGLDDEAQRELADVAADVVETLSREGLRLSADGRAARAAGRIDLPDPVLSPGSDAGGVEQAGLLWALFADGYLDVPPGADELIERYVALSRRQAAYTVGLFEAPR